MYWMHRCMFGRYSCSCIGESIIIIVSIIGSSSTQVCHIFRRIYTHTKGDKKTALHFIDNTIDNAQFTSHRASRYHHCTRKNGSIIPCFYEAFCISSPRRVSVIVIILSCQQCLTSCIWRHFVPTTSLARKDLERFIQSIQEQHSLPSKI